MHYEQPRVLNVSAATRVVESSTNKQDPLVMDNPIDPSSFGSTAAYEADE